MKQRALLIIVLLFIGMNTYSQNKRNNYPDKWKQAIEHSSNSLPKSAIKEVESIINLAIKEKNVPQIMKAYHELESLNRRIDSKYDSGIIAKLEDLLAKTDNTVDQVLLHSVLADMYLRTYYSDSWNIMKRTNLVDTVPADINEWTINIYQDKIFAHLEGTTKNSDDLKRVTALEYEDIIDLGEDSRTFQPTLYDFVMNRTIETAQSMKVMGREEFDPKKAIGHSIETLLKPAKEYINLPIDTSKKYALFKYYQIYLADLLQRGLTSSLILIEMNKYDCLTSRSDDFNNDIQLNALYTYEKEYNKDDATVEIIAAIANVLTGNRHYRIYSDASLGKAKITQAYEWLKKGIEKYPNYRRVDILKNILFGLEEPYLAITGKTLFYNNDSVVVDITHQNNQIAVDSRTLDLYKIDAEKEVFVKTYPIEYNSSKSYEKETTKLDIGKLDFGKYYLRSDANISSYYNGRKDSLLFNVSNLTAYHRNLPDRVVEFFVVDRRNGKPIEGATVKISQAKSYEKNIEELVILVTDKDGRAIFEDKRGDKEYWGNNLYYEASYKEDKYLPSQYVYRDDYSFRQNFDGNIRGATSLFTDRSIYRPGQTVYYKAIVVDKNSKAVNLKKQIVKLYNPNNEVVAEQTLFTNEFGSIADTFILPQGGLTGSYRIEVENETSTYFNVEEYKRPTFEVKFDKIDKTYGFGEKITLKGNAKTFSGISLQNTDVTYNITRNPFSFWFWSRSSGSHFEDGSVVTKDDGSFEIEFIPEAGDGEKIFGRNIYTFNVTATITDLNGETQTADYSVSVGEVSMILNIEVPDQIEKSKEAKITIGAKNLDGVDIETSGTYVIYTLDKNDSIQAKVKEGTFGTGVQKELPQMITKLSSGKHRVIIKGKDDKGKEVEAQKDFVVFSYKDKRPPYETDIWLVRKETVFKGNKPVEIIYGTSRKNAYILYQVYNNKKTFERKFIVLNDENKTFSLPYNTEYGDEVYMSITTVNNGQISTENILLSKEQETVDTQLFIKASVFRDRLRPGQDETWTLSINDSKDKPVSAEVLASMYDISLDQIMPMNRWYFNRPYIQKEYLRNINYNGIHIGTSTYNIRLLTKGSSFGYTSFRFDKLDLRLIEMGVLDLLDEVVVTGVGTQRKVTVTGAVTAVDVAELKSSPQVENQLAGNISGVMADQVSDAAEVVEAPQEETAQVRRNFNETAFFFPQLRTNEKGETLVSFTVPESNTTWRFRAFAHDKDGKIGELEKMVVTRKELMVTPNMPRFIRHGDRTSISTKISNLSENAISGKVRIEFFDPIDEQPIKLDVKDLYQSFNLDKDASSSASWTFDVPQDIDMLGVRIVAESESFSDGEQHALAILPNRMLVTETMPVDVVEKGEQIYTMDKLMDNNSKTLKNYKLSFEFASNPAWYAVQALPTLSNPNNENAFSWFASYYVNTLGASLMKQYPKVANMIKVWTEQGGDKETLVSKLNKNEELKTILMEETPWILDANNETEQMERLALLFDLNNTKQMTSAALTKLQELQRIDGAWSWYKGLYPNRGMTQYLLFGFANLQRIGMVEYPQQVKEMQIKALKYADEQLVKDFEHLKKHNKSWTSIKYISPQQLDYLYMRSMYRDIPISKEAREAERFYTDVVSKNWTKLNLTEKAFLAVVAKELGNTTLADAIVKSLREHAVTNKELGMYWPNNRNWVFMSMSAVGSHVFIMEALKVNGATTEEMDLMKRWLVKQKQTQVWETTNATIHAISVLLQEGSDWFNSSATPVIKVGKQTVEAENKELGSGYFKTSWSASDIKPEMGKVSIISEDNRPAYGSLYWQYYEDLDKITKQDGSLNINKELYREIIGENGKSLEKITEEKPLKVGDKVIVRLVIRSDRDMEFVQIKDMRASCFEPQQVISGIGWQNSIPYYQTTKDASTNFFLDVLPKGTYVFEYVVFVNRTGEYSNGISSIQCAYAPEFTAHSAGIKVTVK